MKVSIEDLKFPPDYEEVRPKAEEAEPQEDPCSPACPSCKVSWDMDEPARSGISICMHCVSPWIVIICPKCKEGFLITASGKSFKASEDHIEMSVAQYWIAKLRK